MHDIGAHSGYLLQNGTHDAIQLSWKMAGLTLKWIHESVRLSGSADHADFADFPDTSGASAELAGTSQAAAVDDDDPAEGGPATGVSVACWAEAGPTGGGGTAHGS